MRDFKVREAGSPSFRVKVREAGGPSYQIDRSHRGRVGSYGLPDPKGSEGTSTYARPTNPYYRYGLYLSRDMYGEIRTPRSQAQ
jgi:hypothetical protein